MNPDALNPHDILRLRGTGAVFAVEEETGIGSAHLLRTPYAVVRRSPARDGAVPIGIRGMLRSERFAAWIGHEDVLAVYTPEMLRKRAASRMLPAFAALTMLNDLWDGLAFSWGPAGSVGFELATGLPAVHSASDLDIVIRVPRALEADIAREIFSTTMNLPCAVDVQLETPGGALSLAEFVSARRPVLLRTRSGPVLTEDPFASPVTA